MLCFLILLLSLICSADSKATSTEELVTFAKNQAAELQGEANKLIQSENLFAEQKADKRCPSQLLGQVGRCANKKPLHNSPKLLVFVSLSMPEASLKELGRQAQKHNAVLVMRGLYQDSFVKTAQKLEELGITVDIHPDLFEQHQVTVVPTFIQIQDGKLIHRLSGNVTLPFCVEKFGEAP